MNATELQDALLNLFETLADARDEIDGDDDDISLADFLRDLADDFDGAPTARSYGRDMMLTRDAGLTVRCADGSELQITIVQTRQGTGGDDEAGDEGRED